ncbi:MAG TPA: hypothetical protein PKV51_06410 [Bacillota bacterium]|nr:hypothetical protein [Bacillota bacterium]HPP84934.1 hypothetical protein [Bacillota bacterium]
MDSSIELTPQKEKKKPSIYLKITIICFLISTILEIFVFNFNSFHLLFGDYEKKNLPIAKAQIQEFVESDGVLFLAGDALSGSSAYVEFSNIDEPVGTISFDIEMNDKIAQTTATIEYTDITNNYQYRYGPSITFINGDSRSYTIPCHFSGKVSNLKIHFNISKNQTITIRNIMINKPIPFRFSLIRYLVLYVTVLLVYIFAKSPAFRKPYRENQTLCFRSVLIATGVFVIIAITLTAAYRTKYSSSIKDDFAAKSGDQLTQELVDAFKNGQVHLLAEPSSSLKSLKNPYDYSERRVEGAYYLWDHCFYNGKYYSYYGIAPVIFLFLPYHLITGYYFPSIWAALLFGVIGIIFLTRLYMLVIKKWFSNLQINYILMGLIILQLSSGIWFSIARPVFYEVAISSGFACLLAGAYFFLSSNVVGEGKISFVRLMVGTLFMALSVMCRPTLAVYCVIALVFIWFGFKKLKASKDYKKSKAVRYFVCALLPFVFFGGIQMLYNYARFDSPFEFGIKYSLTINDFTQAEYHTHFVLVLAYAYLFAAPYFVPDFPFVSSSFHTFNMNGYMYIDDRYVNAISIGLFYRAAIPLISFFFAGKAIKLLDGEARKKAMIGIGLLSVLAPFGIIFAAWESGYAARYNADISWQMMIGAFFILYTLLANCKNKSVHKMVTTAFTVFTFLSFMMNFAQIYSFINPNHVSTELSAKLYSLERLFEFWK